jgi:hypothetical protein
MKFIIIITLLISFINISYARLGEDYTSIKRRINIQAKGEEYEDKLYEDKLNKAPYKNLLEILGEENNLTVKIFWKPSNKDQDFDTTERSNINSNKKKAPPVKAPNYGWDYHVVLSGGKSIIEFYQKNGGMNEFEKFMLLQTLGGGKNWVKLQPKKEVEESAEDSEKDDTSGEEGNSEKKEEDNGFKDLINKLKEDAKKKVKKTKILPANHELEGTTIHADINNKGVLIFNSDLIEKAKPTLIKEAYDKAIEDLKLQYSEVNDSINGF